MKIEAHLRPERLDALLEECLKEAAPRLAARSLSVTHQLGADMPAYDLDRTLMKQAIHCMLAEAIKGAAVAGHLRVTLKANRNALMLAVKAPGEGMTEVQREMLFTGEVRPGTLAYARAIIAAHGGVAWANGMPGRGTTFYLSLPIRRAS